MGQTQGKKKENKKHSKSKEHNNFLYFNSFPLVATRRTIPIVIVLDFTSDSAYYITSFFDKEGAIGFDGDS